MVSGRGVVPQEGVGMVGVAGSCFQGDTTSYFTIEKLAMAALITGRIAARLGPCPPVICSLCSARK